MPVAPPPPLLLITMTGCPRLEDSLSLRRRARMSVIAPGGKGLMICTVLVGNSAASSADVKASNRMNANRRSAATLHGFPAPKRFFIYFPFSLYRPVPLVTESIVRCQPIDGLWAITFESSHRSAYACP